MSNLFNSTTKTGFSTIILLLSFSAGITLLSNGCGSTSIPPSPNINNSNNNSGTNDDNTLGSTIIDDDNLSDADDIISPSGVDDPSDLDPMSLQISAERGFCCNPYAVEFSIAREDGTPVTNAIYNWDMGDGRSRTGLNPDHTYSRDGSYNVSVEVITGDGDILIFESTLTLTTNSSGVTDLLVSSTNSQTDDNPGDNNDDNEPFILILNADAGGVIAAFPGETITLDGSNTNYNGEAPLTYNWTQTDGSPMSLSNTDSVAARFTAPLFIEQSETLTFRLTVSNGSVTDSDTVMVLLQTDDITIAEFPDPVDEEDEEESPDTPDVPVTDPVSPPPGGGGSAPVGPPTPPPPPPAPPAPNSAPTSQNETAAVYSEDANSISFSGSDADNDSLTFVITATPLHGQLGAIVSNGSNGATVTYTPHNGFFGADQFSFIVTDGEDSSPEYSYNLNVLDSNLQPTVSDQAVSTQAYQLVTFSMTGVSPEDNNLTFSVLSPPSGGIITNIISTGSDSVNITYRPNRGFFGFDSFSVIATDGTHVSDPAFVSMNVVPLPVTAKPVFIGTTGLANSWLTHFTNANRPAWGRMTVGVQHDKDVDSTAAISVIQNARAYGFEASPMLLHLDLHDDEDWFDINFWSDFATYVEDLAPWVEADGYIYFDWEPYQLSGPFRYPRLERLDELTTAMQPFTDAMVNNNLKAASIQGSLDQRMNLVLLAAGVDVKLYSWDTLFAPYQYQEPGNDWYGGWLSYKADVETTPNVIAKPSFFARCILDDFQQEIAHYGFDEYAVYFAWQGAEGVPGSPTREDRWHFGMDDWNVYETEP